MHGKDTFCHAPYDSVSYIRFKGSGIRPLSSSSPAIFFIIHQNGVFVKLFGYKFWLVYKNIIISVKFTVISIKPK